MVHPGMAKAFAIQRFDNRLAGREGPEMEDVYRKVIAALDRAGVRWALIGAHALNVYLRPRATDDIDLVIDARRLDEALAAIVAELGEVTTDDIGAAVRVLDPPIDLIRSDNHTLFHTALDEAVDRQGVRVPTPELLVALKFLAATSPWRRAADRGQDTADLVRLYQDLGSKLDLETTLRHAASVYPGAETELAEMFKRVDRGEKVSI
jgi:hypothetical protein